MTSSDALVDVERDAELRQVLIHGPQPVTVEIVEYDNSWPDRFSRLAEQLRSRLGERARRIEHIGSTGVPGLAAKDRIDICITVDDPDDEPVYRTELEQSGWVLTVKEPGHRCFRHASPNEANLHVYADESSEVADYLLLRDWLRDHPEDRDRYAELKRELARRGEWPDMNYYADAKGPLIHELLEKAHRLGPAK